MFRNGIHVNDISTILPHDWLFVIAGSLWESIFVCKQFLTAVRLSTFCPCAHVVQGNLPSAQNYTFCSLFSVRKSPSANFWEEFNCDSVGWVTRLLGGLPHAQRDIFRLKEFRVHLTKHTLCRENRGFVRQGEHAANMSLLCSKCHRTLISDSVKVLLEYPGMLAILSIQIRTILRYFYLLRPKAKKHPAFSTYDNSRAISTSDWAVIYRSPVPTRIWRSWEDRSCCRNFWRRRESSARASSIAKGTKAKANHNRNNWIALLFFHDCATSHTQTPHLLVVDFAIRCPGASICDHSCWSLSRYSPSLFDLSPLPWHFRIRDIMLLRLGWISESDMKQNQGTCVTPWKYNKDLFWLENSFDGLQHDSSISIAPTSLLASPGQAWMSHAAVQQSAG
jgi:hypothetical protein